MTIVHDYVKEVKNQNASESSEPSVADFLNENPLPERLKHFEPVIRRLPSVDVALETIVAASFFGMDNAGVLSALEAVAGFFEKSEHRCASCLDWTTEPFPCGAKKSGKIEMLAFCPACHDAIMAGRQTATMTANLKSYGGAA